MIPLLIALQFLTRLPVSLPGMPTPEQVGRSLLWYPLVGLLLGLLLWGAHLLLGQASAVLQAAIILALWVGLSGGLHLDGLADTADAWVGGFADRERTLAIMKDPRSGPIAVVVLVLLLLLKFAALFTLLQAGQGIYLLLLPWLGRSLLPLLLATTPYVRVGGLGQALVDHLPRGIALGAGRASAGHAAVRLDGAAGVGHGIAAVHLAAPRVATAPGRHHRRYGRRAGRAG